MRLLRLSGQQALWPNTPLTTLCQTRRAIPQQNQGEREGPSGTQNSELKTLSRCGAGTWGGDSSVLTSRMTKKIQDEVDFGYSADSSQGEIASNSELIDFQVNSVSAGSSYTNLMAHYGSHNSEVRLSNMETFIVHSCLRAATVLSNLRTLI